MSGLRGYESWRPKAETLYWIGQVEEILDEYRDYLPISLRQVFYSLVDRGFEKTEKAYGRLGTWVARARRAMMLPFDAFTDEQGKSRGGGGYDGPAQFWRSVRATAEYYRRDRTIGQPRRLEVWSEATGIGRQLERVAGPYSVPVRISRGYTSVTNTHDLADRALDFEGETVVLHIGDHDPSGVGLYDSMRRDAGSFLRQKVAWDRPDLVNGEYLPTMEDLAAYGAPTLRFERVALTPEQIAEYAIETAPPKPSDSRTKTWVGESAQAEALPPDLLAQIVDEAIRAELDLDRYRAELEQEKADKAAIEKVLEGVDA